MSSAKSESSLATFLKQNGEENCVLVDKELQYMIEKKKKKTFNCHNNQTGVFKGSAALLQYVF